MKLTKGNLGLREMGLIQILDHPNVVKILAWTNPPGCIFAPLLT
jgi:hypothetical protein